MARLCSLRDCVLATMFVALALVSCAGAAWRAIPEENVMLPTMEPGVDPALQAQRAERTRLLATDSVTVDPGGKTKEEALKCSTKYDDLVHWAMKARPFIDDRNVTLTMPICEYLAFVERNFHSAKISPVDSIDFVQSSAPANPSHRLLLGRVLFTSRMRRWTLLWL
eukprot:SM000095S24966  [mRNA]  locus=s95:178098:180394:- [translate_table: standard]